MSERSMNTEIIHSIIKVWPVEEFLDDENINDSQGEFSPRFGECTIRDLPGFLVAEGAEGLNQVIGELACIQQPQRMCCATICADGVPQLYGRVKEQLFVPYIFNADLICKTYVDKDANGRRMSITSIPKNSEFTIRAGHVIDYGEILSKRYYTGELKLNPEYPISSRIDILVTTVYRDYYYCYKYAGLGKIA